MDEKKNKTKQNSKREKPSGDDGKYDTIELTDYREKRTEFTGM